MARRGRSLRGSQSQLLLEMPFRTQSQRTLMHIHKNTVIIKLKFTQFFFTVSGIEGVHLTDAMNQAKQYSYHLRPHSAGQGTTGRGKH